MTWNFRLVKHKDQRSSSFWYGIHEVFYNEAGRPFTMTEDPVDIAGRSPKEVRGYLKMIQRDIERLPVLDAHRTKWVRPPWVLGKRARTPLERAVDWEPISKGKEVLKDFDESQAFQFAEAVHRDQKRKGSEIPYITHLMAVAAIVGESGGDEEQMIAALLHDSMEDQTRLLRSRWSLAMTKVILIPDRVMG